MKKYFGITIIIFSLASAAFASGGSKNVDIISTIKPIHSLVDNLIEGTKITSDVLVDGSSSAHEFALKPKQIEYINNAKLVFFIDSNFETFLTKALENSPKEVEKENIINGTKIKLLIVRKDPHWEQHSHEDEDTHESEHHHHDSIYDLHIWLSVKNAVLISDFLANKIKAKFPSEASLIDLNLKNLKTKLNELDKKIATKLKPIKDKPYIMFHDAFQYFEKDYDLGSVGAITIDPEQTPNPKRIAELHEIVKKLDKTCVFSEPQFDAKLVKTIIEGTNAKSSTLDENGASYIKGKDLYFNLINQISENLSTCLTDK